MGKDPFRQPQGNVDMAQVALQSLRVENAALKNRIMAMQEKYKLLMGRLEEGERAINFLIMAAKKAKAEGKDGVRVSSLIQHQPGPTDGFEHVLDEATNEWRIFHVVVEKGPDGKPVEAKPAAAEGEGEDGAAAAQVSAELPSVPSEHRPRLLVPPGA